MKYADGNLANIFCIGLDWKFEVLNLATATLTLSFAVPDSCGGESDPELVEVLRGGQELREQGHVEDPPA